MLVARWFLCFKILVIVSQASDKRIPTDSDLSLALFDFGGQSIFNVIHHLFITPLGMYAIVFNMEFLRDASGAEYAECTDYMRFWLNSLIVSVNIGLVTSDDYFYLLTLM